MNIISNKYKVFAGLAAALMLAVTMPLQAIAATAKVSGPYIPLTYFAQNWHPIAGPEPTFPVGAIRINDYYTMWSKLEPANGVYDWTNLDSFLTSAQTKSSDIMYTFIGLPLWNSGTSTPTPPCPTATDGGTYGCVGIPSDPTARTNYLNNWAAFVTNIVKHANGRIKYWEMWNEPDYYLFWPGDIPDTRGTAAGMAQMSAVAIPIIRANDPGAVIVSPGTMEWSATNASSWTASYLDALATYGQHVDIVAFHAYTPEQTTPESYLIDLANAVKNVRQAKPVFMTEGGWGEDDWLSPADQVNYLAKAMTLYASLGIQRYYWYQYNSQTWGTLETNGQLNAAGIAYEQVQNWLSGDTFTKSCSVDSSGTWRCPLIKTHIPWHYSGEIIWNSTKTVSLARGNFVYLHTLSGKTSVLGSTFKVGASPVLIDSW